MNRRLIVAVLAVWIVSLVGVAVWAQNDLRRVPTALEGQPVGDVITGTDIGFQRVAAESQPGKVVGKWMVKINGKWVEAQPLVGIVR
jgi:hypothetical protein